jgi:hypothetical protein
MQKRQSGSSSSPQFGTGLLRLIAAAERAIINHALVRQFTTTEGAVHVLRAAH